MKKILVMTLLFISVVILMSTKASDNAWITDYNAAVEKAKQESKKVLVNFSGSDWCANCMRLERILFETDEFKQISKEEFVLLRLDFPSRKKNKLSEEQTKHNEQLAEKYNKSGVFPLVLVLDTDGTVLGQMKYPASKAEDYIASLKSIIQ